MFLNDSLGHRYHAEFGPPARGMIAVSGEFPVTPETRSCSSFAGRG